MMKRTFPLHALAAALLPRFCVICDARMDAAASFPLCDRCAAALPRITGATCEHCGKPLISEKGICMRCRLALYRFNRVIALFSYVDSMKTLLSAYKTNERISLARFFAAEISTVIKKNYSTCLVVPVPPRPGKIRKKGWDQVDAIMRELSARHGIAVTKALRRVRGDVQQKTLNHEQRAENILGKFYFHSALALPPRIVLVDDVFTTGATLSECAGVLKDAGAVSVDAVCLAID